MNYPDYSIQLKQHIQDYYDYKHWLECLILRGEAELEYNYWY